MHARGPKSASSLLRLELRAFVSCRRLLVLCSNIMHGSDSVESAAHEIGMWFTPAELIGWTSHSYNMIYE